MERLGYASAGAAIKRTPYTIRVRCYLNGADTTAVIYLKNDRDALERMRHYVPRHERNAIRLIECRPSTEAEIRAHKERIQAAIDA